MASDELYERSLATVGAQAAEPLRLHAVLQRLLPMLADHEHVQRFRRHCGIAPQHIVSLPWHPGRLADARRKRAAGSTPPPLDVTRVRTPSQVWYLVSDGMHRSWAAREAGAARIGARIAGEVPCTPEAFELKHGPAGWELWRDGPPSAFLCDVPPAWFPIARQLGVRCPAS